MAGADIAEWIVRLLVAGALGALVGTERESRGHPAGVRTQALVALASALLTGVGAEGFAGAAADPTRVASQIVTGIGFIGAGVILKHGGTVRGLTTAATLWLSAALGVAVGAGMIIPAVMAAVAAFVLMFGLSTLKPFIRRRSAHTLHVEYERGHGTIGPMLRSLQQIGGTIDDVTIEDETEDGEPVRHVWVRLITGDDSELRRVADAMRDRPEVRSVSVLDS
ncbi:MAG: MgtC/SapB family protein [Acidimicrobiia bacterium]|nr:MgtC/SapB family protein [Acidimicrobiia bacterium]